MEKKWHEKMIYIGCVVHGEKRGVGMSAKEMNDIYIFIMKCEEKGVLIPLQINSLEIFDK